MLFPRPLLSPDAPPAGGPPTGTTVPAPGAPSPTEVIQLPRAEYEKLIATRTSTETLEGKLKSLESNWTQARMLLAKDKSNADPTALVAAARNTLKEAGWNPEEIEQYIRGDAPDDDTEEPADEPATRRKTTPEDDRYAQLEAKLAALQQEQSGSRLTQLNGLFQNAVVSTLDTHKDLGTLVTKLVELRGPGGDPEETKTARSEVLDSLREELDKTLRERLRVRRSTSGNAWSDVWIGEEAVKAAEAVYGRFRKFVGDPSKLGRTRDADLDVESIHNTPPVPEPVYKPGKTTDAAKTELEKLWVDQLLRMGPKPANAV